MMSPSSSRIDALRFHDDFDGIASGALLLAALAQQVPANTHAVAYSTDRASWLETNLPRGVAVVDFLYHPDAAVWFDHHHSPFLRAAPEKLDSLHVWDVTAPSCAGLIARHFSMAGRWAELASWADKIDGARWRSPAESLDYSIPAVRIYNSLLGPEFESYALHLMNLLLSHDLSTAAGDSIVQDRANLAHRLLQQGMVHLERYAKCEDGIAMVECERARNAYVIPRYGMYTLFPDANYMLLNQQQPVGWKVTVSRNPWKRVSGPHLGQVAKGLGGGGHHDVGALNVETVENARAAAATFAQKLRLA
jgi:hypothetical protein